MDRGYSMAMRLFLLPLLLLAASCTFGGPRPIASVLDSGRVEPVFDVPYVTTPYPVVAAMLDLAEVGPQDHLIDLGSGDGRIVIAAAERGARGLGVEIDPGLVARANGYARGAGVEGRARFIRQDLFQTPLREASVVTLYLLPEINLRLRPRLLTELRPGTRVVAHAFGMGDWRPDAHRVVDGANIYLWTVPAPVGGDWRLTRADGSGGTLRIDQRFQEVAGTLDGAALEEAVVSGETLRFRAGGRTYEGRLTAAEIEGEGWTARRL